MKRENIMAEKTPLDAKFDTALTNSPSMVKLSIAIKEAAEENIGFKQALADWEKRVEESNDKLENLKRQMELIHDVVADVKKTVCFKK